MTKRIVLLFFAIGFFVPTALGLNFKQVAYIPSGVIWGYGYIKGGDFNHDGFQDLVFTPDFPGVVYYGYRPFNHYVFEDSVSSPSLFWDVGDLDGDSLLDVLVQGDSNPTSIRVIESSDYWTFPKIRVWNWPYEWFGSYIQPMYITDLDRDGRKEILTSDASVVYVFENQGNNQYVKVFSDTAPRSPTGGFAIGDFDGDGQMEFACGAGGHPPDTSVFIYECTGPDQYRMSWFDTLNAINISDCISLPNIKGNGKTDFMIGSLKTGPGTWYAQMFIYESTGINQYHVIYADSLPVTDRGGYFVHSDCGDLFHDGKQELVWAIDRTWMVYKYDSLSHQFQRVFTAYGGDNGKNSTNVTIHDMNGNGYPEIIESGGNETHIWEVETCHLVYPNGGETLYADSQCVIRWLNVDPFRADSFSLFFSSDSGYTYTPIAHGIPGIDSTYSWTVNDTVSTRCFIMLWAYQNATGWDFSDAPFTVRRPNGVEASSHVSRLTSHLPYRVTPNPFISCASVPGHVAESFALYDVSGRKVSTYKGDRIGEGLSAGIYFLKSEGQDAKPLRIVKLR